MKIYFCGSIAGGRNFLDNYKKIVSYLHERDHTVLTEHIVHDNVLKLENKLTAEEIYSRDIELLEQSDCVIAEISNPSLGVGYEICYAEKFSKRVLCLYVDGIRVSKMITGINSENILCRSYRSDEEMIELINRFLAAK